jgi:hypothetical protein
VPFALTFAAAADGRATGFLAAASPGQGGAWWLVDRAGRVVGRGRQVGPEVFATLLAYAGAPADRR